MRRNTRVIPIFRSKLDLANGPYATANSVPMVGNVNAHGALWTVLMTGAAGGFGTLASLPDNADGVAVSTTNIDLLTIARGTIFDGTDWDRRYSASGLNLGTFNSIGAALVTPPGNWSVANQPGAGVAGVATRAGVAGVRHVCTTITVSLATTAAQIPDAVVLRDGASGVGAVLWAAAFCAIIGDMQAIALSSLNIVGTAGNAMTLEFAAAPAAGNFGYVTLGGYDATDLV